MTYRLQESPADGHRQAARVVVAGVLRGGRTRVVDELTERRLEGGGIYVVGRIGTARVRVQKSWTRVDDAGKPIAIWQVVLVEEAQRSSRPGRVPPSTPTAAGIARVTVTGEVDRE